MKDLQKFLNMLSTGALILKRQDDDSWKAISYNHALTGLRQAPCERLLGRSPTEFMVPSEKSNNTLCKGLPTKGNADLPTHTAMFEMDENEQLRVKVKYDWVDDDTIIMWVEPFSEDVALTQAHADFVSVVSHEFRTPLTSIKGFADTILRYGNNMNEEQRKRFINIIKHQADRLTRLVENLLTVSKLGAQRTQFIFRPINVKKVVDRIVESLEAKLPEPRKFIINIPDDLPDVWADPDKIEQVLLNLIDNAAKYSYGNSEVRVNAYLNPENEDMVKIDVTDQGVGIPPENLPKIFNKFSRIDNPLTREVEGTGLGLYITKSLTKAMGGDISVTSVLDKGSTFTVELPIATPERQSAAARMEGDEELV